MKSTGLDAVIIATPFICIITLVAVLFNANTKHEEDMLSRKEACKIAYSQNTELFPNHPQQRTIDVYVANYNTLCNS